VRHPVFLTDRLLAEDAQQPPREEFGSLEPVSLGVRVCALEQILFHAQTDHGRTPPDLRPISAAFEIAPAPS